MNELQLTSDEKEYQVSMFFLIFQQKRVVGYILDAPGEDLLMCTHKVCFRGEMRKHINAFWLLWICFAVMFNR